MKLYFIRHGESQGNASGIVCGWQDCPLTQKGRRQAKNAGKDLQRMQIKIDHLVASPLGRAKETAELVAEAIDFPAEKISFNLDARERHQGKYEGGPKPPLWEAIEDGTAERDIEPFAEFTDRCRRLLADLRKREGVVLLVAHNGTGRVLRQLIDRPLEIDEVWHQQPQIENATVVKMI